MNEPWCTQNRDRRTNVTEGTRHGSSFSNRWVCDVLLSALLPLTRLMCSTDDTFTSLVFFSFALFLHLKDQIEVILAARPEPERTFRALL